MNQDQNPTSQIGNTNSETSTDQSGTVATPEWEQIKSKGGLYGFLSTLLFIGFAACLAALFITQNQNFAFGGAGCLAAALWLHQSAQLLHIRALLQKRESNLDPTAKNAKSTEQPSV
jgi:hypothetical protein